MTTHVMLDLETMSTAPDAAIVQVGAVAFDPEGVEPLYATFDSKRHFERTVALQSSLLAGGRIDEETVAWWCRQNPIARSAIESNCERLGVVLNAFRLWFERLYPGVRDGTAAPRRSESHVLIWSHGAAFDLSVLESAYVCLGLEAPWYYRNARDTRTLFDLATELAGWSKPPRTVAHSALMDAVAQAEDLRAARRALYGFSKRR
jgi:exodeoxyribonuclease VIII